jgi:hypothetical protein
MHLEPELIQETEKKKISTKYRYIGILYYHHHRNIMGNHYIQYLHHTFLSSITVFVGYLETIWRNPFNLTCYFYYIINKLIILIHDSH